MNAGDEDDLRTIARLERERRQRDSRDRVVAVIRDQVYRKDALAADRRRARRAADLRRGRRDYA